MKALVLSSGGVDSTTALGMAIAKYGALSISYGQKHDKEIQAASAVAKYYGVEQLFLDLSLIFSYSNSSLLKQSTEEIPEESYAEQIKETGGNKPVSTYVPFRNGLFLSSAASIALSKDCGVIYYGAHADDAAGCAYPDCSPVFNNAMNEAAAKSPAESAAPASTERQRLQLTELKTRQSAIAIDGICLIGMEKENERN